MDSARHVVKHLLNPRCLKSMNMFDEVGRIIHQSLRVVAAGDAAAAQGMQRGQPCGGAQEERAGRPARREGAPPRCAA